MSNEWRSQNCMVRIRWNLPTLPPTERSIAQFVLENPERVISLTMEELAEQTHSSYATVNRFCRRLEYAGYREFCHGLLTYLTSEKDISQMAEELEPHAASTVPAICANVHRLAKRVLDDSFDLIDAATVEAVAAALIHAGTVCFAGVGTSGLVAQYAHSRLFRIGLNCHYFPDSTLCHMQAALLGPGDVLFVISSSGRTARVVETAAVCKEKGVTVVGLSDFCVTPLAKVCDHHLFTTGRTAEHTVDRDIQFITGQIAILDVLYLYCCALLGNVAGTPYAETVLSADREKLPHKRGGKQN